jgi:hypothetical protein
MISPFDQSVVTPITVVLNWTSELKHRMAGAQ